MIILKFYCDFKYFDPVWTQYILKGSEKYPDREFSESNYPNTID